MQTTLAQSTRSPQAFEQAKYWIQDCRQNHKECHRSRQDATLPTRLVCVKREEPGSGSEPELSAHICESDSLSANVLYLTLSHAWGTEKFVTLTQSNLDQFRTSIPFKTLSRTFQEAIHVVSGLGFQYIWIDSLCIVQDDQKDWERESLKMGDVYAFAVCNLTASAFDTGGLGISPQERLSNPVPPRVCIKSSKWRSSVAFIICEGQPWRENWERPIFRRAWVLQEQILAIRALHFGRDQMFWECKHTLANEVWPVGRMISSNRAPVNRRRQFDARRLNHYSNDSLRLQKSPYDTWMKIVYDYSSRKLTYASDRLPALSGIASLFTTILEKDEYLLGLWKKDIHRGLLWRQTESPGDFNKPDWSHAPSWSWASLN
ncbi:HET-domain-containing protein, partial [Byssothecium circinans]